MGLDVAGGLIRQRQRPGPATNEAHVMTKKNAPPCPDLTELAAANRAVQRTAAWAATMAQPDSHPHTADRVAFEALDLFRLLAALVEADPRHLGRPEGYPEHGWPAAPAALMRALRSVYHALGDLVVTEPEDPYDKLAGRRPVLLDFVALAAEVDKLAREYLGAPVAGATKKHDRAALELAAIAELSFANGRPNVKRIAEKLGVPRSTLRSWPTFAEALRRINTQAAVAKQSRRRGRRAGDRDFEIDE
jgi:hypothetical protein